MKTQWISVASALALAAVASHGGWTQHADGLDRVAASDGVGSNGSPTTGGSVGGTRSGTGTDVMGRPNDGRGVTGGADTRDTTGAKARDGGSTGGGMNGTGTGTGIGAGTAGTAPGSVGGTDAGAGAGAGRPGGGMGSTGGAAGAGAGAGAGAAGAVGH